MVRWKVMERIKGAELPNLLLFIEAMSLKVCGAPTPQSG